jgi:hypothetical protein
MTDNILKRRSKSGFVNYPKSFDKRIIDGTARFRTKCDMLIGPCACGGVHQENDDFVRELLFGNTATIEPMTLPVGDNGCVTMPRYWYKPRGHERCTVLSGLCACGKRHAANEQWVVDLLATHNATIVGCPETALPIIPDSTASEVINSDHDDDILGGCDCESCRAEREHQRRRRRERETPRRNQI